jgi:hypothetical protein
LKKSSLYLWAIPIGVAIVYIVPKILPSFEFIENNRNVSGALNSISVSSEINATLGRSIKINLQSEGTYKFKDLELSCEFKGQSGTSISAVNSTIYQIFSNSYTQSVELETDIPRQASEVQCEPVGLTVTAKMNCVKGLNEQGELVDKNCYWELL